MIWLTGDTHGDFHRLSTKRFPQQKEMTHDDFIIIMGDFGGIFQNSREERYWLDWLNKKNFTTLWIDGNHENFPLLESYPKVPFHGGMAHQIRPHVYHLCRGYHFQLGGHDFYALGGAQSHDCLILDPDSPRFSYRKKLFQRHNISFRVIGESWWPQELPGINDYLIATAHLHRDFGSDDCIILTHCAPTDIQRRLFPDYPVNELTDFLQTFCRPRPYRHWFCGHYHQSISLPEERFTVLHEELNLLK